MPSRVIAWMAAPPVAPGLYVLTTGRRSAAGEIEVKAGRALNIAARLFDHRAEISHRARRLGHPARCTLLAAALIADRAAQKVAERDLLRALRAAGRRVGAEDWPHAREWFWVAPDSLVATLRGGA